MIPEAPFFFSVAALSVSLAGFAGLVGAFRRGTDWRPIDVFRLREIAEFGLTTALIALLPIPLAATSSDLPVSMRIAAVIGLAYLIGGSLVLERRRRSLRLTSTMAWYALAGVIDAGALGAAIATIVAGAVGLFEWLLLFLLARPMFAFLLVVSSLRDVD
jgi:hypothetical protein